MNHIIKSSKKRTIKDFKLIGRGNNNAIRINSFHKHKERCEYSAHFAYIIVTFTIGTNCIKFVKKINAIILLYGIKYLTKLCTGRTHIFCDNLVEPNNIKRQICLFGDNTGRHCFTCTGNATKENFIPVLKSIAL